MKTASAHRDEPPRTFDGLVALHAPRPIRDDVDYDNTTEVVDRLAVLRRRTRDQEDYLQTLATLVEAYDREHHAADLSHVRPIDTLRHLMEQHNMTAADLGRLLGTQSVGSKILRGERELSKTHIRTLCDHFKIGPELFL